MRILVTGDRNYRNAKAMYAVFNDLNLGYDATIIHGDARGADTMADTMAQLWSLNIERYPADWDTYGRGAGPIRNKQMLDTGIDLCLAFHEDFDNSKGTADMVRRCLEAGVPVRLNGEDYV